MLSETLPILESPLKKPKLNTDDISPSSPLSDLSSDESDGLEHIDDKDLIEDILKYERQLEESECFDIDFVPTEFRRIIGTHVLPCDLNDPEEMDLIQGCTDFAIAEYNRLMKSKSQLQLVKIEKANKRGRFNYACFITFEAVDTVSNQSATYQTRMLCGHDKKYKQMFFIRRKDTRKEFLFPVDLEDKEMYERIKKCTDYAISEYSEIQGGKPQQLQLMRIVKAVQDTAEHHVYRLAFEAMDTISRQTNTYFAEVTYDTEMNGLMGVLDVWPKGLKNHEYDTFVEDEWSCLEDGVLGRM
ncbi:unnamed protein product [Cuscuta epithymum]|uniref:Cystatin domain-containing protein n=1 Tax=Cuscuta epithymum TaxID=186058 RepID=A0AAV0DBG6_9ASTE|nr:unnamed protein product [Cuscuta epithymum]CAH9124216.1 unnamed protein product [Cuscuta epithymum]